ncbi:Phosphatidylinositol / phosphatidylcholine transfer protein [Yarrowia lipolytica]|nr:Phosphatidylinositol / phosphatidylcholine transfer protein [Yarrowia lipolytica]
MTVTEQEFLASYPQKVAPGGPTGYPGNLTAEQEQKLGELKMILLTKGYEDRTDDATLLRFLRARKFDVPLAQEMWENCEKWRKEFGTNTILEDFWYKEKKEVAKLYPQYYHKTDKDGRPVYVENVGKVNIHEMYKITTQERMLRNLVWEYESFVRHRLPACSRVVGHLIETSCTILDLKGVSLSSASQVYGFLKDASNIGQNYYPERMGKFYLINAPFGFSTVFSVIKRFLDPVTVSKIHVYGSNYKEKLLAQVPAYNLPIKFGGQSSSKIGVELSDDGPWRDPQFVGPEGLAPVAGERPTGAPSIVSNSSTYAKSTASTKVGADDKATDAKANGNGAAAAAAGAGTAAAGGAAAAAGASSKQAAPAQAAPAQAAKAPVPAAAKTATAPAPTGKTAAPQTNSFPPEMLAMMEQNEKKAEKAAEAKTKGGAAPQANAFTDEQLAQLNSLPQQVATGGVSQPLPDSHVTQGVPTVAKIAEAAAGPHEDAHLPH